MGQKRKYTTFRTRGQPSEIILSGNSIRCGILYILYKGLVSLFISAKSVNIGL